MTKFATIVGLLLSLGVLGPAGTAWADAEQALQCRLPQKLDRYRLLRRLSLDLRQHLPSYEEYTALDDETDVPEALIDEWLLSDGFRIAMRRFHESLLWPNVYGTQFNNVNVRLVKRQGDIWSVQGAGRRNAWRKAAGQPNTDEICGDFEQTEFLGGGDPGDEPITSIVTDEFGDDYKQDGWVWVNPYWDPANPIKVCAYDAQTASLGGSNVQCDSPYALYVPQCGCGEDLRWCYGDRELVDERIWAALREQMARLVDEVSVGQRPYTDLVLTQDVWSNGVVDFWKQHLSKVVSLSRTMDLPTADDEPLPTEPDFLDETWELRQRSGLHAGIQTLPAYTLRFQTNRARANRFRVVFSQQYFIPPAVASLDGCDSDAADLTQRCVCKDCHQVVEPLAAYFGNISEAGSGLLTDKEIFPLYYETCDPTSGLYQGRLFCDRYYVTETDEDTVSPGTLRPYQYADLDGEIYAQINANLEAGPKAFAELYVYETEVFFESMVRHLFRYLMGRDMNLDITDPSHELGLLSELASQFQADNSLRSLVKDLVMLEQYRRVR
jgi:hypothetical protein